MPGKTFLMAGGGTGGHVIPALAVARELKQRGHKVFFVGTARGMEAKLVPAEGFELQTIDIGGLNRVGLKQKLATIVQVLQAGGAEGQRGLFSSTTERLEVPSSAWVDTLPVRP